MGLNPSPELSSGPVNFYFECKPEPGNEPEPGLYLLSFDDHKKNVDAVKSKIEEIDDRVKYFESYLEEPYNLENRCEEIEEEQEYLENMSRRSNIKILDLPE